MKKERTTDMRAQASRAELFFALVQVAVGKRECLPAVPSPEMWVALFKEAQRQAMAGVIYGAVEKLPSEQRPPKMLLLQWYALAERIRAMNKKMNARAVEAHRYFSENGFPNVIMKGQAMARLYDAPLLRTSGDIDIWLDGGTRKVHAFAAAAGPVEGMTHCHVHFPLFPDIEVEAHVRPSTLFDLFRDRRLQRWFRKMAPSQFTNEVELPGNAGRIAVPTADFDRIYILLHIYQHLFGEGIGLRQLTDYYYVLRQGCTAEEREAAVRTFRSLGMMRFARATSWIMLHVFRLEECKLLVPPDEREGRFVLHEIMTGGNFGKYDPRYDRSNHDRLIPRVLTSLRRNFVFLRSYPREILWNPVARTVWYFERMINKRRIK